MTQGPIEPDEVEYLDRPPTHVSPSRGPDDSIDSTPTGPQYGSGYQRTVLYQNTGMPCCSGCGCLIFALLLIALFPMTSVFSAILIILAGAWISASILRISGVHRYSPAYAYLLVPLFMVVVNFIGKIIRGNYLYSTREIIVGTLVLWLFLYVAGKVAGRK
jgi:hypothetical protein